MPKSRNDRIYDALTADCFANFLQAYNLKNYFEREDKKDKALFNFKGSSENSKVLEFVRAFQVFKD